MDKLKRTKINKMSVKENKMPLSRKAKAKIIEYIDLNNLKADDKIPSENVLKEMIGVSRYTVREALALLEQERWIYKVQGRGTFVRGNLDIEIEAGLERLDSITEIMKKFGHVPNTKWISIEETFPTSDMMEKLNIGKEDKVVTFKRIRLADEKPAAYLVDTIAKKIIDDKVPDEIIDQSLFNYLRESFQIHIEYAVADIKPILPTREMKEYLNIRKNRPFLLLHQIHYDKNESPVFYSFDYFDPEVFKFKVNRKR